MLKYDPLKPPDPAQWLALDEGTRIAIVEQYHRRAKIRMPNHAIHASIHAVVETQIAEGQAVPAKETLERLMREGLDRHDAVHAIGTVLSGHIYKLLNHAKFSGDPNDEYCQNLKELTAAKWLKEYS